VHAQTCSPAYATTLPRAVYESSFWTSRRCTKRLAIIYVPSVRLQPHMSSWLQPLPVIRPSVGLVSSHDRRILRLPATSGYIREILTRSLSPAHRAVKFIYHSENSNDRTQVAAVLTAKGRIVAAATCRAASSMSTACEHVLRRWV